MLRAVGAGRALGRGCGCPHWGLYVAARGCTWVVVAEGYSGTLYPVTVWSESAAGLWVPRLEGTGGCRRKGTVGLCVPSRTVGVGVVGFRAVAVRVQGDGVPRGRAVSEPIAAAAGGGSAGLSQRGCKGSGARLAGCRAVRAEAAGVALSVGPGEGGRSMCGGRNNDAAGSRCRGRGLRKRGSSF